MNEKCPFCKKETLTSSAVESQFMIQIDFYCTNCHMGTTIVGLNILAIAEDQNDPTKRIYPNHNLTDQLFMS